MERLNPLNDFLFLKLMGEEGNEMQCLAFLNAVLGSKSKGAVQEVTLWQPFLYKKFTNKNNHDKITT